jgi:hypothetical protein
MSRDGEISTRVAIDLFNYGSLGPFNTPVRTEPQNTTTTSQRVQRRSEIILKLSETAHSLCILFFAYYVHDSRIPLHV